MCLDHDTTVKQHNKRQLIPNIYSRHHHSMTEGLLTLTFNLCSNKAKIQPYARHTFISFSFLLFLVCCLVVISLRAKQICSRQHSHFFPKKIRFNIACELPVHQTIHMKYQTLFSLKTKQTNQKCHLLHL